MLDKLEKLVKKYDDLQTQIQDPAITQDPEKIKTIGIQLAEIEPIVEQINQYKKILTNIRDAEDLIETEKDDELLQMAKTELETLKQDKKIYEEDLRIALLPQDPRDTKNVIMEIRAGTGGEEAGLFAAELLRMYLRYADIQGWKTEILSMKETGIGGVKEVIFAIYGHGAYSRLKFESGAHRVQRVPVTESSGRLHTSAATVAVLPEAEEVDVQIDEEDIKTDVFRSSGHGGQSVNTTDSAVRITHLPTKMVVTCQDERSQLKNKAKAMNILRARLFALEQETIAKERGDARRVQVGSGDRSEKIRTYNFPQDRITDHRIHTNISGLQAFMDGNLDKIIDPLILAHQTKLLSGQNQL